MNGSPPQAFANRYVAAKVFVATPRENLDRFFNSVANFVGAEVLGRLVSGYEAVRFDAVNEAISEAHRAAAMELGKRGLFRMREAMLSYKTCYIDDCLNYLVDGRQPAEERLSFLEYLLMLCSRRLQHVWQVVEERIDRFLKASSLRIAYRELTFRPVDAALIENEVHKPFWELIEDRPWVNVRADMEQALALRDSGGPDPAFYAARALESAIKVISNLNSWSTGHEKGAASYIDNLVSQKNGRFVEVWEADALKHFFGKVRNPTAHGAGDAEQPRLGKHQATWAIEFCMIWIKSLVGRM
ncbi:hypothetical protein [Methylorubrum zatmanii]|uniref:DUF4145 domain-containing protein n=1 Tax=Methylorubrum zatmanii TaxID=29429 RepID=A0ABW1WNW0_9HYPH|nr:hypothetical protein [Methylorubrum zatmanii]MBD8907197.1 hypothetical protein [Methylorubrum zatmanii]